MEITKTEKDGVTVIKISGRLDSSNSKEAQKEILASEDEGSRILLNLGDLEYISSAGLRVLLISAKKARSGHGKFCLCSLTENVNDVFEVSGFSAIFDVAENEEAGVKFLSS